ncbi:MAG: hypothetical protein KIT09_03965 [Bryobacteraceae bacterium]|nr:hypothetical protein [Bryobacteraceae bacterium]
MEHIYLAAFPFTGSTTGRLPLEVFAPAVFNSVHLRGSASREAGSPRADSSFH